MKLPLQPDDVLAHLQLHGQQIFHGPYPPKGFVAIKNSEDDVGDCVGLYWPLGRESTEPLVCTTTYDAYSLEPLFSSLEKFIQGVQRLAVAINEPPPEIEVPRSLSPWVITEEWESPELPSDLHWNLNWSGESVECPTLEEDPNSPSALVLAAQEHLENNHVDEGIRLLRHAVRILPEYTEAWAMLCQQYRRRREEDLAAEAALMAMICPQWFGAVPHVVLQHFQRMKAPPSLENDPCVKRRARFRSKCEPDTTGAAISLLQECIDEYFASGDFVKAILLHQQYAASMLANSVDFQQRHGFTREGFHYQQAEYFTRYLGDPREFGGPSS